MKTTLFSNLKKILTVQRIALLVAVCSLIVMLIVNWHNIFPKKTTVKDNIREYIVVIDSQFAPNKWDADSTFISSEIVGFENSVLGAASAWKKMDEMKPFKNMNEDEFRSSVAYYFSLNSDFNKSIYSIVLHLTNLRDVETTKDVLNFRDIVDDNRLDYISKLAIEKDSIFQIYTNNTALMNNKKDMMNELDKMRADPNYYKLDEALFKMAIEVDNYVSRKTRK
ncbi:MAG: hypothetical protein IJR13_00400 [Bacteroidales bacterium]|nr:hypothetical protein [Bacteroidales bacterium]